MKGRARRPGVRQLDAMIAEALVDAYGTDEAPSAWCATLEDKLAVPFATQVLGIEVTVVRVELSTAGEVVALCTRGRKRLSVPLLDLPLPQPPPIGVEWIDAYRRWVVAQ